jgi:hypothetical protein
MLIVAKSSDPAQEQLRQRKRNWNKASKEFIKRLIAFKKGLNGRGDPGYGLEPSNIADPFPSSIGNFMSELSSNFEQLVFEAQQITQEQAYYSEHRRKPQPKATEPVAPPTQPEEAPSPLAGLKASVYTHSLVKNAETIHLFRGLLQSDFNSSLSHGFKATKHPGNVASKDFETALHWAGQRGDENDPALVVEFDASSEMLAEDPWFKGDYRFVKDFHPQNLHILRKDIVSPVKFASLSKVSKNIATKWNVR